MQQALALAEQARWHAPPNPWVGCIIVHQDKIVGRGWTQPPGHAHAEIVALKEAEGQTQGATLYVTLEPCCHTGRTPPCVRAIIQAGVSRVLIAQLDPDHRVSGKGMSQLREAGIEVLEGLCHDQAVEALLPYLHQRRTGIPYTVLKAAISLDGRLAATDGSSQWITSPEARQEVHLQRAASQAIVIGTGTALSDQPRLTVRHETIHPLIPPLRVLLDAKGRVPPVGPLFDLTLAPTLVVTTDRACHAQKEAWQAAGIEVMTVANEAKGVNLLETWQMLGARGILQILVEGGGTLFSELLKQQLCQQLSIYMGNCLLGIQGAPLFQENILNISQAPRFSLKEVKKFGNSVRLDYQYHELVS